MNKKMIIPLVLAATALISVTGCGTKTIIVQSITETTTVAETTTDETTTMPEASTTATTELQTETGKEKFADALILPKQNLDDVCIHNIAYKN